MKENKIIITTALVLTAILLFVPVAMTQQQQTAFAQSVPEDKNGVELKQPYTSFTLAYTQQWFANSGTFRENFIQDDPPNEHLGSMRMEWVGTYSPSVMMAGYFKLSADSCTNFPNEEISAKMNGGPHNDNNPTWADTMDLGGIDFEGEDSRVRYEKTHPNYGPTHNTATSPATALPLATNLCDTPDGWVGVMAFKTNVDTNCNGSADRWIIRNYVDISGLNTDGTPKNNWQLTYVKTFHPDTLSSLGGGARIVPDEIKSWQVAWVYSNGHPEVTYQTWRIDNQGWNDWNDATNNYKFITMKRTAVSTNPSACPEGLLASSESAPEALALGDEGSETVVGENTEDNDVITTQSNNEEEGDELAQEDDPQDPDNNDVTAEEEEEEEEEEDE